jgi:Uma2 family endonuclease
MMTVATPVKSEKIYYTPEEYLELENQSEIKHEYLDGEIIEMTGGTTNHNKLAGKIYARLLLDLLRKYQAIANFVFKESS